MLEIGTVAEFGVMAKKSVTGMCGQGSGSEVRMMLFLLLFDQHLCLILEEVKRLRKGAIK